MFLTSLVLDSVLRNYIKLDVDGERGWQASLRQNIFVEANFLNIEGNESIFGGIFQL